MAQIKPLNIEDISNQIRQFIINNYLFGNEKDMVEKNDSFLENGVIDSTGILELIEFIEQTFNIEVKNDELVPENFDSLNNVSNYLLKKLK